MVSGEIVTIADLFPGYCIGFGDMCSEHVAEQGFCIYRTIDTLSLRHLCLSNPEILGQSIYSCDDTGHWKRNLHHCDHSVMLASPEVV